ncbi:MAG: RNA polymerase sigma factor [Chloroflexi bacterium]|nr:MAG: RNA polymerase sigma factor [Chloroflexota bacterium]
MVKRMPSLDETIRKSSPGDPLVYEALMVEYFNFILRLTNSILLEPCEADDATQETFIQATTHLADYQTGTNIKNWLAKIAINTCRDKLRRMKTRNRLLDILKIMSWQNMQASPTPEETVIRNERLRTVQEVVEALDEKHRLPVLLRYVQGMSVSEIAEVLEVNEGTVHSRLHYAHLKLRERLQKLTGEQPGLIKEGY